MKTIPEGLLQAIVERLVAEFHPEQIILFGSHAWGTPTEDSDIDLLVVVPESNEKPTQRATRGYRCLRDMVVPKDIVVKTRAEAERFRNVRASLEHRIFTQGKLLYG